MAILQQSTGIHTVNQSSGGTGMTWRRPIAFIFTPLNKTYTPADIPGLKLALQNDATVDDAGNRIYIMKDILEAEPANTNPTTLEFGYGYTEQVYNGQYGLNLSYSSSNLIHQFLRQQFNDRYQDFLCIAVDSDYNFIWTQNSDTTNGAVFQGFGIFQWRANDVAWDTGAGAKQTAYIQFNDRNEFNNGNMIVQATTINPRLIRNVSSVYVSVVAGPSGARVISLAFPIANRWEGVNMATKFGTILAANPSLVTFTNRATGAPVAVSTAAVGVINGNDVITYTLSATNYPTTGQYLDIKPGVVSAFSTLNMKYYEGVETMSVLVP